MNAICFDILENWSEMAAKTRIIRDASQEIIDRLLTCRYVDTSLTVQNVAFSRNKKLKGIKSRSGSK